MGDRKIIIVGMACAFDGDPEGAEIWCVNASYRMQDNVDRLYFLDNLVDMERCDPDFVDRVNRLEIPIYSQREHFVLPFSRAYPLDAVVDEFGDYCFTSSIAYMIAHAILEGVSCIQLHGLLRHLDQRDYMDQKACMDFWSGVAVGRGIRLEISAGCQVTLPHPWQAKHYGYEKGRPEVRAHIMGEKA